MKDYYQILRVNRKAGEGEIKRAYRRLAVVFHPDKNPSAEALALFQEINEAHEVLLDPDKRFQYDQILAGGFEAPPSSQRWHRDPAYRRRQQQGYRPPPARPSERLLMMVHFLRYLRVISFVGLGWCAFLILDYLLPFRISKEIVLPEGNRTVTWQMHHEPNVLVTDKGHQFPIPYESVGFFPVGSRVEVVSSRILNLVVKVDAENNRYSVRSLATVYQNFILAPIVLLMVSLAGLLVKKGIEFRFNIEVSICIMLVFNLLFLLFSIL